MRRLRSSDPFALQEEFVDHRVLTIEDDLFSAEPASSKGVQHSELPRAIAASGQPQQGAPPTPRRPLEHVGNSRRIAAQQVGSNQLHSPKSHLAQSMKQPSSLLVVQDVFQPLIHTAADRFDHVEIIFQYLRCPLAVAIQSVQVINIICYQYGFCHHESLPRWQYILAHFKIRETDSGISKETPTENSHAHRCLEIKDLRCVSSRCDEVAPAPKHGTFERGIVVLEVKTSPIIEGK